MAELAGAGIQDPQLAVVKARRMGHRKAAADNGVARHVDDHSTPRPVVAPAVGHIGLADAGDIGRPAVAHGEAVEMATILGGETRHEPPGRLEAWVALAVAMQENSVLANTRPPSAAKARSCTSSSAVKVAVWRMKTAS
jgi:hypothetical protein